MRFDPTDIPDIILVQPEVHEDHRGFFMETYRSDLFADHGISEAFVQDNHSSSCRGTLRGLHYQVRQPQGKLLRVVTGEIFDVTVDLRRSSPSFGRWVGAILSGENKHLLWAPPGVAHGFYVLSDRAEVTYKTTDYYAAEWERTLLWNDPDLRIEWPLAENEMPLLSEKDAQGKPLAQAELFN